MPGYDEIADIDVINGNMDKIDVQMKKNADSAQQSKRHLTAVSGYRLLVEQSLES